jgi:Phospholipase_D-nuclease N-terminal
MTFLALGLGIRALFSLVVLGASILAVIDIASSGRRSIGEKLLLILLVLMFPLLGSAVYFFVLKKKG